MISQSINELRSVRQESGETEQSFIKRINGTVSRCGNVYDADEIITLFIDGLDSTARTVVARLREAHRNSNYLKVAHYSRSEGDSVRERNGSIINKLDGIAPERVTHIGIVQFSSESGAQILSPKGPQYESVHYVRKTE